MVGEGTYGKVYKAKLKFEVAMVQPLVPAQPGSQAQMVEYRALKLLKLDEEREGWPITSLREIVLLKKLSHKNIVSLIDVFVYRKENA